MTVREIQDGQDRVSPASQTVADGVFVPSADAAHAGQAAPPAPAPRPAPGGDVPARETTRDVSAAKEAKAEASDYQQAASAFLDAAGLVARVIPGTRAGRAVNMAMPVARSVVANAPQIVEKAAPVLSKVAEKAPDVAEKAAKGLGKGLGRLGRFAKKAAGAAIGGVVDGAKQAVVEYRRERDG